MISRKKKVFAQFLLHTLRATKNRVTHQKAGLYLNLSSDIVLSVVNTETGILGAPVGSVNPLYSLFGLFYLMLSVNNIHNSTPFSLNPV